LRVKSRIWYLAWYQKVNFMLTFVWSLISNRPILISAAQPIDINF
jgi:hypothetical protein